MNFSLFLFFMALKHNVIYFCRVFCTCTRLPQCGAQLPNCVHTHTHKYIPGILSLIIEFIELHARLTCKRERKNDVNDDCLNHEGLESASKYVYTCRNHGEQGSGAAGEERGREEGFIYCKMPVNVPQFHSYLPRYRQQQHLQHFRFT